MSEIKTYPYIFSFKQNWNFFNIKKETLLFDCSNIVSQSFFNDLILLDELSFGAQGMGMARWVLYDCASMPGAITGYAINKNDYIKDFPFLEKFKGEMIPISMFIAIPMIEDHTWFAHNLSSIGSLLKMRGLGLQTKSYGINTLKISNLYGATQWGSPAIHIHSQLANMELVTSHTPNHSHENTITYKSTYKENFNYPQDKRISVDYDILLAANNFEKQKKIQHEIESGESIMINGRPLDIEGVWHYPLKYK